jgi:hypothetical protein
MVMAAASPRPFKKTTNLIPVVTLPKKYSKKLTRSDTHAYFLVNNKRKKAQKNHDVKGRNR